MHNWIESRLWPGGRPISAKVRRRLLGRNAKMAVERQRQGAQVTALTDPGTAFWGGTAWRGVGMWLVGVVAAGTLLAGSVAVWAATLGTRQLGTLTVESVDRTADLAVSESVDGNGRTVWRITGWGDYTYPQATTLSVSSTTRRLSDYYECTLVADVGGGSTVRDDDCFGPAPLGGSSVSNDFTVDAVTLTLTRTDLANLGEELTFPVKATIDDGRSFN